MTPAIPRPAIIGAVLIVVLSYTWARYRVATAASERAEAQSAHDNVQRMASVVSGASGNQRKDLYQAFEAAKQAAGIPADRLNGVQQRSGMQQAIDARLQGLTQAQAYGLLDEIQRHHPGLQVIDLTMAPSTNATAGQLDLAITLAPRAP